MKITVWVHMEQLRKFQEGRRAICHLEKPDRMRDTDYLHDIYLECQIDPDEMFYEKGPHVFRHNEKAVAYIQPAEKKNTEVPHLSPTKLNGTLEHSSHRATDTDPTLQTDELVLGHLVVPKRDNQD